MAIGSAGGIGGNTIGGIYIGGQGIENKGGGGNNPPYAPGLYISTQDGNQIATQNNDLLVTN
jgi:hypothetical protein